jgi:HSP20 family molecular chaperone IbpA
LGVKKYLSKNNIQKGLNKTLEKINEGLFGNYKRPSITISQNDKFLYISVEMKDLNKENIDLIVNNMSLDVIGEKRKANLEKSSYKGYKASIALPTNVNMDEIEAEFISDFLRISIPKIKTQLGSRVDIK